MCLLTLQFGASPHSTGEEFPMHHFPMTLALLADIKMDLPFRSFQDYFQQIAIVQGFKTAGVMFNCATAVCFGQMTKECDVQEASSSYFVL